MKIKFPRITNFTNVGLILSFVFVIVVIIELYFVYNSLYLNYRVAEVNPSSNIVRVNLEDYHNAIDLLNSYEQYEPGPMFLLRPNPFE